MERVGSPRGIDGEHSAGHGPAIGRLLRALTAAAALGVAGTLDAQEPSAKNVAAVDVKTVAPAANGVTEARVRELLAGLDADEFDVRERASKELRDVLEGAYDADSAEADALVARLRTSPGGAPRTISPEQNARLMLAESAVALWKTDLPHALPAANAAVRGDAALHAVKTKAGVPIHADDATLDTLAAEEVRLDGERKTRVLNRVLGGLCAKAGLKPQPLPNGDLRLVPLRDGERVSWSEYLIGVRSRDADGTERLTLQLEPGRGVIVAFMDGNGAFARGLQKEYVFPPDRPVGGPLAKLALGAADDGRTPWKGGFAPTLVHGGMDSFHSTHAYAVVADAPATATLAPLDGSRDVGPQTIGMGKPAQSPDGGWEFTVGSTVCGDVPWPRTPCPWDVLTYKLAHANRYVVRDAEGREMHATVVDTTFDQRRMTVKISCPREPVSVDVRAFTRMQPRWLELPDVTPPAPPAPR